MPSATQEPSTATRQGLARDQPPITEPDLGVIEEAARRRRRRRIRNLRAAVLAVGLAGVAVVVGLSGSHRAQGTAVPPSRGLTIRARDAHAAPFNVRVWPGLAVGMPEWCMVIEEGGRVGGSGCSTLPTASYPLGGIYGEGPVSSRRTRSFTITGPRVAALVVDGGQRVDTVALRGLPFGFRAARWFVPTGSTVVALDQRGRRIPLRLSAPSPESFVKRWRYPASPPRGICALRSSGLPMRSARGGAVALALRPLTHQIVGRAFLPCVATEYFLHGVPLKAFIVLDAANPAGQVAPLPDFHPVRGAPGFYAEGGTLTARHSGNTWIVAEQGTGLGERTLLLRHLTATTSLGS
jgi:hypothetical protein